MKDISFLSRTFARGVLAGLMAVALALAAAGCAFWSTHDDGGRSDEVYSLPARMRRPDELPERWKASSLTGVDERTRQIERNLGVR